MKSAYLVFSSSLTIPTSHTSPGIVWSQAAIGAENILFIHKEYIAQKQTMQLVSACATQSTMPIQIVVQLNGRLRAHPTLKSRGSFHVQKMSIVVSI